ncbi:transcriptional regulator [Streptomyces albospinus]|uniref:Transcriptional regulator n=1 Tax=Streptomyces albospinus TaxID=285515 RepID=A0ABQ2VAW8_9ACTN|nr:helix-turn-helix domain-containing protein [Streptomyces albospinus]GGU73172.1 transcriptional regulator [Streptomyces albospinus]
MGLDDASLTALAVLGDELRRRMFDVIRREHRPLTREEVAARVGISRKLAAFHLDKLVAAGLLRAHYASPSGIRKVGRHPKLYEPAAEAIEVSVPERRFQLLADLLAEAVRSEAPGESAHDAAVRVAGERGRNIGAAERLRTRPGRLGAERGLSLAIETLDGFGFEPERSTPTLVLLRNCPFHPLAAKAPEVVCDINQAFLAGYLQGLGSDATDAVLAPHSGRCCVELRARTSATGGDGVEAACDRRPERQR